MNAIVRAQYGSSDVLQFAEVATPKPADYEVMIKLCAASVKSLDLFLMKVRRGTE
jgi:NADPH:quinone reductase-like Zn-dependent oxidoreductase